MSEPATEAADPAGPAEPSWAEQHADYEGRLAAHREEAALFGGKQAAKSSRRRSDWDWLQNRQAAYSGSLGFRSFATGRSELTGTPKYDTDWLKLDRPEVERGLGPLQSGFADAVARRQGAKVVSNRAAELEAERQRLEATREPEFAVEETPLTGGPASTFPRATLPKGTQFAGVSFDRM